MRPENNTKPAETLLLGSFRYEPATEQLTDPDGKIVHLRRQSADVLAVLAAHDGEIVSKEVLIETVWPGIATTDDSLVQCIADIRRTLGREVVQTFPKKGYRLQSTEPAEKRTDPKTPRSPSLKQLAGGAALLVCLALAIFALSMLAPTPAPEGVGGQAIVPPTVQSNNTLAVLPFVNLSADAQLRFFSDGLSEDLTTDLSKVPQLTVISHASSFDYPNAERGFRQIAEDLGVRYLVRGTVRHDGDRVRINVSLIDPFGGLNLWSERYDRDRRDPFDVQEDVTRQVTKALSLELGVPETVPQRIEPDAYYMLLKGLEPLRELTASGNAEARSYFLRALELDPEYARAHANVAVTYGRETLHRHPDDISDTSIADGLQAAITAIQLDPTIPHAYYALGVLNLAIKEYDNALAAARHAIQLDVNYSDGYALLAEAGVLGGDLDEALAAIRRARLLHPHHPFSYHWIEGHILFQLRRFDDAQPLLEAAVEANPSFLQARIVLAANYGHQGNVAKAQSMLNATRESHPEFASVLSQMPYRYDDRSGNLSEGLRKAGMGF